ncbi:glutathione S-transferase family protein [Wenxinia marina]|uniref:Glutathione S-transferase n=1 Tax=Wenxinia marina DSM 24838 TaxID=1123501 RepID=A0A0D0QBX5_9RHOB|nr:glutathione S-transferase family protein [Wenxinia marina]KIQ69787.1 Glutathione S-transferase [Wenxinia marina DSM 24838]GGL61190.1 glutathione S-transferase [Wenxinia marina]
MITVYGEGRGFRVLWMLEEMGLPYRLVDIDLLSDAPHDPDFLAINPSGFIPAIRDGEVGMVESIAILEVLAARHGPTPLVPAQDDPAYPTYRQFLLMGEAGIATAAFYLMNLRRVSGEEDSPGIRFARYQFDSRVALVARQLERTEHVAGDAFTAADISVTYGLNHGTIYSGLAVPEVVETYLGRVRSRPAYRRAVEASTHSKAFLPEGERGATGA